MTRPTPLDKTMVSQHESTVKLTPRRSIGDATTSYPVGRSESRRVLHDASEQPGDLRDIAERRQCRPERRFCGAVSTQGGREPSECRLRRLLSRSLCGRHVDCHCPPTDEGQSAVL